MRKTSLFLFLLAFLLATGCRPVRTTQSTQTFRADSVLIVETLRDTVVTVKADSSLIRALIECDSLGKATINRLLEYQAGDRLKPPDIVIDDHNVLTAQVGIDSLSIYLQLKDRHEKTISFQKEATTETVSVEVNRLTRWQRFWVRMGPPASLLVVFLVINLFNRAISTLRRKIFRW